MSGLNSVVLCGYLGKDAQLRKVGETSVATMSVAVTETWKKANQKQERTDWFTVEVWGKLADGLEPYLKKGRQIVCRGKLRTDSYEKEGKKVYVTKVRAEEVVLTNQRAGGDGQRPTGDEPVSRGDDGTESW